MVYTDGVHLMADDLRELHRFAKSIGLKRSWFQDHPRHPHYDLTSPNKLERAILHGAKFLEPKKLLEKIGEKKNEHSHRSYAGRGGEICGQPMRMKQDGMASNM